jgi:putative component of membrane protein insertase Oxa1/YidC/SpoIIIJ protein YidD
MVLRYAVAGAISRYQRHLSPQKGYCCAHRSLHGGWSCSEFGRRVVLRFGTYRFLLLQTRRFAKCASAAAMLQQQSPTDEPEYKDFPWKQCIQNKKVQAYAAACCCMPLNW